MTTGNRGGEHSKQIENFFSLAAFFNFGIVIASKGFSDNLAKVDPLFNTKEMIMILLWGLAYLGTARSYTHAPAISLVFALEKLYYGIYWVHWMLVNHHYTEIRSIIEKDFLCGFFFASYGVVDFTFAFIFFYAAQKHFDKLFTGTTGLSIPVRSKVD